MAASFCLGFLLAWGFPAFSGNLHATSATIAPQLSDIQLTATQPTIAPATDANSLERGRSLYDRQEYDRAISLFERAAREYEAAGMPLNQAIALNYLSLTHQKLGHWERAQEVIDESFALLTARSDRSDLSYLQVFAQAQTTRGHLHFTRGEASDALESWQQAEATYDRLGEPHGNGAIGSRINQAQALEMLGNYRRSCKIVLQAFAIGVRDCESLSDRQQTTDRNHTFESLSVEQILDRVENLPEHYPSQHRANGLRILGNTLRTLGKLDESHDVLEVSLNWAKQGSLAEQSATLLSLGNTERSRTLKNNDNTNDRALEYYRQAEATAGDRFEILKTQAQLNQLSLLVDNSRWDEATELSKNITAPLNIFPPSRLSIYDQINFVQSQFCLQRQEPFCMRQRESSERDSSSHRHLDLTEEIQGLELAIAKAEDIEDARAISYALGNLGRLYEKIHDYPKAKDITQKALYLAASTQNLDIEYQWNWQLGRLLLTHEDRHPKEAIAAYSNSVEILQNLRGDLVSLNRDFQFDFKQEVEPIYRKLVELLLYSISEEAVPDRSIEQQKLEKAIQVIENLHVAELDNFFREACITQADTDIRSLEPNAIFIYTIILDRSLELIVRSEDELYLYSNAIDKETVENNVKAFREKLPEQLFSNEDKAISQTVYRMLFEDARYRNQKIESLLEKKEKSEPILVFVLDDILQNIPMSALYDGEKYLVDRYPIAQISGLNLLKNKSNINNIDILAAGVNEQNLDFPQLPYVKKELDQIKEYFPNTKILFNKYFTRKQLDREINNYPFSVLHMATHGKFSSNAEETFLAAFQDKINVNELDNILKPREITYEQPIELIILSACETAQGDPRAALGLAGVAIRAGARSTIASLWSIGDDSTSDLVSYIYEELKNSSESLTLGNRAKLLQQAQLKLKEDPNFKYPSSWAPYILVGHW